MWLYIRSWFMICFRQKMIDVARISTYTCLRRPTDNMMNKSNCSRPKSTHIQYIQRQCRIRITNTITLYESVLGCRRCSFDNTIFSLIIMVVSWFLCLSIFLLSSNRMSVFPNSINNSKRCWPFFSFFFLAIFFSWYNLCLYIYKLHVKCAKWWPSSLFISDRVMVECACVYVCVSRHRHAMPQEKCIYIYAI